VFRMSNATRPRLRARTIRGAPDRAPGASVAWYRRPSGSVAKRRPCAKKCAKKDRKKGRRRLKSIPGGEVKRSWSRVHAPGRPRTGA
jgi:hypothetical protein